MKSVFVMLGLLLCTEAGGYGTKFVPVGEDLLLEVAEAAVPYDFTTVQWTFNTMYSLVTFPSGGEPIVSDLYRGRVEVSVKKFSVKLKNLQKSDSGVYKPRVLGTDYAKIMPEYVVTVTDPVKLTVNSVTNSSDSCDLTVTCRSLDSKYVTVFTCNTTTCSQGIGYGRQNFGPAVDVYLKNDMIICDQTYMLKRTNDSIRIDDFCPRHTSSESLSAGVSVCLVKTVVFSVGLVVMVTAVISVHVMERLKKKN